jgi:hypothetical protein
LGGIATFAGSVVWERHRRNVEIATSPPVSSDEKWTRLKMDLDRIDRKLERTTDQSSRKVLSYQKRWLEAELRKLEWVMKESDLNNMYNATRRSLRESSAGGPARLASDNGRAGPGRVTGAKESGNAFDRKNLEKILDNAESILKVEPYASLSSALIPISNDFRAHYNAIKRRSRDSTSLSDYWVSWAIILSIESGVSVDASMSKYASNEFRPRIAKFLKFVESLNLPAKPMTVAESGFESGESIES